MTGAELVTAIKLRALELGVPLKDYAAPLSRDPYQWLKQMRMAEAPKPHTIARVQALLAGEYVPPPPPNNFQASRRPLPMMVNVRNYVDPATVPEPLDREPCFFCGIRADFGCKHRRPS